MSFSLQVKNELAKTEYENNCCKKSLLYGMAIFGKKFSKKAMTLQTENINIANLYKDLAKELCNIDADLLVSPSGKIFTVSITNTADATKLLNYFGHSTNETSLKVNFSNFACDSCQNAFFAGAFLACGTMSNPRKDYHLEFSVAYLNLSKSLMTALQEFELHPKYANRKGYNIIYFKESESIEDCLYLMGASSSMFDMMNEKIIKDIRNSANRKANCETANIEKMVRAASPQLTAIKKIQDTVGLDSLTPQLKETALIRLENPELSLSELAQVFEPEISRSGANHRLKRLVEIAEKL